MKDNGIRLLILLVITALVMFGAGCRKKAEPGGVKPENALSEAAETSAATEGGTAIAETGRGRLEVKGAGYEGHEVRNVMTGEVAGKVSSLQSTISLPAGTYEVLFGKTAWKGVEIKPGSTTVLEPGGLTIRHASLQGHDVIEASAGVVQGSVSALKDTLTLIPGRYVILFGKLEWPVEIQPGLTTTISPGVVEVVRADISGHPIYDKTGDIVGQVSATMSSIPLPPGDYEIDLDGKRVSFTLKEGDSLKFER